MREAAGTIGIKTFVKPGAMKLGRLTRKD